MSAPRPRSSSTVPPRPASDPPKLEITEETETEKEAVDDLLERTSSVDVHADASAERTEEQNAVATAPVIPVGETSGASAGAPAAAASVAELPAAASVKAPRIRVDETPHPAEVDLPDFRPRRRGRAAFALVGIAAALVVAIGAWSRFASRGEVPAVPVPVAAQERAPEKAPVTPSPAPAPVATATNVAAGPSTPAVETTVAASNEKAPPAGVIVTVKVVPEDAVIFRAGKRLGAGTAEVSIENNVKQRLTALLDGYTPSNFIVDGSSTSITIMLKRAPKPRPAPVATDDSPYGDAPSSDATAAPTATAASTATATAPTEGTTQPSTEPNVAP